MPIKKYYWTNPDKCNSYENKRRKRLTKLGFRGGNLSPISYLRQLDIRKAWNKAHAYVAAEASRKYRKKIRSTVGGVGPWCQFLFKLAGGASAYNKKMLQLSELQANPESLRRNSDTAKFDKSNAKTSRSLDMQHLPARQKTSRRCKKTHVRKAK